MQNQFLIKDFIIAIGDNQKAIILKEPSMESREKTCYEEQTFDDFGLVEYKENPGVYKASLCIDGEKDWHTMEYNEEAYFVNMEELWSLPTK